MEIAGVVGPLEINLLEPQAADPKRVAVICHPHPLFGGTMDNKVAHTLAKTFRDQGLLAVRFNFRGVGKSAGTHDNGIGEQDDLRAVLTWLALQGKTEVVLAGFSFGAGIVLQVAARGDLPLILKQIITVAPAVNHFPSQILAPITVPWLLLQGDADEIVDPESVYAWAATREPAPMVIRFPDVGHFFHGALLQLDEAVEKAIIKV